MIEDVVAWRSSLGAQSFYGIDSSKPAQMLRMQTSPVMDADAPKLCVSKSYRTSPTTSREAVFLTVPELAIFSPTSEMKSPTESRIPHTPKRHLLFPPSLISRHIRLKYRVPALSEHDRCCMRLQLSLFPEQCASRHMDLWTLFPLPSLQYLAGAGAGGRRFFSSRLFIPLNKLLRLLILDGGSNRSSSASKEAICSSASSCRRRRQSSKDLSSESSPMTARVATPFDFLDCEYPSSRVMDPAMPSSSRNSLTFFFLIRLSRSYEMLPVKEPPGPQ